LTRALMARGEMLPRPRRLRWSTLEVDQAQGVVEEVVAVEARSDWSGAWRNRGVRTGEFLAIATCQREKTQVIQWSG
jgi:hypothetical protein